MYLFVLSCIWLCSFPVAQLSTLVQHQACGTQISKGSGRVESLPTQIAGQIGNPSLCLMLSLCVCLQVHTRVHVRVCVSTFKNAAHYNKWLAKTSLKSTKNLACICFDAKPVPVQLHLGSLSALPFIHSSVFFHFCSPQFHNTVFPNYLNVFPPPLVGLRLPTGVLWSLFIFLSFLARSSSPTAFLFLPLILFFGCVADLPLRSDLSGFKLSPTAACLSS